jgi:hypothetical protein
MPTGRCNAWPPEWVARGAPRFEWLQPTLCGDACDALEVVGSRQHTSRAALRQRVEPYVGEVHAALQVDPSQLRAPPANFR